MIGFDDLPGGQYILFGNQKRPYGLDHLNSSRYNVFIERPFIIEAFNEDARRFGIQVYGLSEDKRWNWRYGVFNQENIQASGNFIGDDVQPEVAGRIANTAYWGRDGKDYFHWALAATYAFPDGDPDPGDASNAGRFRTRPESRSVSRWLNTGRIDDIDSYQLGAVEAVWNRGPLQLVGEFQHTWVSRNDDTDLKFSQPEQELLRRARDPRQRMRQKGQLAV